MFEFDNINKIVKELKENDIGISNANVISMAIRIYTKKKNTFIDNPLKILTSFRNAAMKGTQLSNEMKKEIFDNKVELRRFPLDVIYKELEKGAFKQNYLEMMSELGVLDEIIPELRDLRGMLQKSKHHTKDVYFHTIKSLQYIPENFELKIAMLLHDVGKRDSVIKEGYYPNHEKESKIKAENILRRLKFPEDKIKRIIRLVGEHMSIGHLLSDKKLTDRAIKRFLNKNGDILNDLEIIFQADNKSDNPILDEEMKSYNELMLRVYKIKEKLDNNDIKLDIDGIDIMDLGYKGSSISKIKNQILQEVKNGNLENDREILLEHLRNLKLQRRV